MGIRIKPRIIFKIRILSFFMAFVLVFVGLPYVGAEAAAGDVTLQGAISATTTESSIKATLNGQTDTTDNNGKTYTYNGNIKTTNVKLFDYFSDSEYGGTGSPSQSWDNGYSNPYNKFNTAVSSDYPDSYTPTNTITLNYKGNKIAANQSTVYAHLWCSYDSSYSTEWQVGIPMTWDSANSQYTVTFNPSTVPNNQMKNSAKKFDADHMPDKVIFHLNGSTTNREEFSQAMMLEHTYTFGVTGSSGPTTINLHITHDPNSINSAKLNIGSSSWDLRQMSYVSGATGSYKDFTCVIPAGDLSFTPDIFQCNFNNDSGWWTNQLSITWVEGNTYTINYASANTISMSSTSGSGQDSSSVLVEGPDCKYTDPLYFGAFYMSNNGTDYTDTNKPGLPDGKSGGPYNNFYWQSHISLKGNTNSYNATRGKAALQGLVDPNLTGNSASGELQQGGKILPYFNETWANTNNNVMTYY